jgi:hypothetical protein
MTLRHTDKWRPGPDPEGASPKEPDTRGRPPAGSVRESVRPETAGGTLRDLTSKTNNLQAGLRILGLRQK